MSASEQRRGEAGASGLFASLQRLLGTLVEIVQTRVAIVGTEIEEERERLREEKLLGLTAGFFLALGMVTGTVFLAVLYWDAHRLLVLGGLTALYLFIGAVALLRLRQRVRTRPKLFATTLAELAKDREKLRP